MTASWEDIKRGIRSVTDKVILETEELAEDAALAIKRKNAETRLSDAYAALGKEAVDAASLTAVYLRKPQAERERDEKMQSGQ